jgi:hypothetical protein
VGLAWLNDGDLAAAGGYFRKAVETAAERGCPDYLPPALLGLAMVESDPEKRREYLRACIESAERRARYVDKVYCLEKAGEMLAEISNQ